MRYFSSSNRSELRKCNSYSYSGQKYYHKKEEGELTRSLSQASQLSTSTKSNKRKLLYRVSTSFIPSCVLSPNRNPLEELYRLFPQLPPGEKPLNGFTCALHKDILLQGKMIICSNCICFHSNIFGYETRVIIYFKNVLAIRREKTAFVVPNAISIRTLHKRYFFCSFLSRESVYKLLSRIWKTSTVKSEDIENEQESTLTFPKTTNTELKRLHPLLFTSSSSSYESTLGNTSYINEYPERPHTSPPSLINLASTKEVDSRKYDDQVDNATYSDSTSSIDDEGYALVEKHALFKSNSIGDLRELEYIAAQLGTRKIEKVGKEMLEKHNKYKANTKHTDNKYSTTKLKAYIKFMHSEGLKYPAFWLLSFLILLLAVLSFTLLIRINHLSSSLQNNSSPQVNTFNEFGKMKEIFEFRDGIHAAKVERLKSILSINLETVNEVNEALRELRRKLQ